MFTSNFSGVATFGYHRIGSIFPGVNTSVYQISGNAKTYFTTPPTKLRPFVNGGAGAYIFSSATTHFGGNVGAGILYEITPKFGVQGSYNYHIVNTSGSNFKFSTVQGGVRFVF